MQNGRTTADGLRIDSPNGVEKPKLAGMTRGSAGPNVLGVQQLVQCVKVDGFWQVVIDAGRCGARKVFVVGKTGNGDDAHCEVVSYVVLHLFQSTALRFP